MTPRRKPHAGDYKAKIVVEAIKGRQTINQLATKYCHLLTAYKSAPMLL